MPYVCCRGCALRFYTAAAYTTRAHCPGCDLPARGRRRVRGLDDPAFAALYDAQASELLAFFVRRVGDTPVARALWAETLAHAHVIRRRFRGDGPEQAASWLEAIAYRQLARYRARGEVDTVHLRRLELQPPRHDRADPIGAFRALVVGEPRTVRAPDAFQ